MKITAYQIAERFIGIKEVPGQVANPQILAMLKLDSNWPDDDSVPWCSGFINYIAWLLNLHRTKSLRARSWLNEKIIVWQEAVKGFDLIILKRGNGIQPGPEVINAPGHVGFFDSWDGDFVKILAGNENDSVKISRHRKSKILGIRRLTINGKEII
ncbi:MAG: hypothetical protein PF440_12110 [Thiomicrorhabdus sp.]|nr:hypothetical protein [Thiomicrorhabdus sp.]